ncbi:MAG: hypothetical protein A2X64_05295 [Ignavibacteria bacterium GWF2_33_9]|nr:MAG: hypothetical protein A2X64_05295 [Ignavibacteria bacterium GWF2_33_9]
MIDLKYFNINKLRFDIRYKTDANGLMPIAIFLHGFKSFRNWGFIPYICEVVAENSFISINLDFELNGIINENLVEFDTELFAENTVSRELQNAIDLISLIRNGANKELNFFLSEKWNGDIHLLGHSRGGGIAILAANQLNGISKIGLLAPIGYFDRYTQRLKKQWMDNGFLEFKDLMSKQMLRMNSSYLIDLENHKDDFNILEIAPKLRNKVQIIHGEMDLSVPLKEVNELYKSFLKNIDYNSKTNCNFVLLQKANHLFNVQHPFESSNSILEDVCNLLVNFLKSNEEN